MAGTGFVDGKNNTARLQKMMAGYMGYPDANIMMKYSKDWTPMADEPIGAWTTNHWTWYSNNYSKDTWYGWETMNTFGTGTYRIEEFSKIMRVSDNSKGWAKYEAAGAYDAGWGNYTPDGVPKYVVFEDTVTVYDAGTDEVVFTVSFINGVNKGLGKPIF